MAKFYSCPHCGSNLDLNERCDCQDEVKKKKHTPQERTEQQVFAKGNKWAKENFLATH